ncbi:MAG TPA: hypothetical protein QF753_15955 [Victivallales bacterium]|nr:hypothetical protein [Victivallales bacterium]
MRIVNQKSRFQIFRSKYTPVKHDKSGDIVKGTGRSQFKLIGSFSIYEINRETFLPSALKTGRNKDNILEIDKVLNQSEINELQVYLTKWCKEEDQKQKLSHYEILFHSLICELQDIIENFDSVPISKDEITTYYKSIEELNRKLENSGKFNPNKKKSGWGRKFIIKK